MRKESTFFHSDSEEEEELSLCTPPCVKNLLSHPNPLMSKQEFSPYECKCYFPGPCHPVQIPETLHEDTNYMVELEESAFQQDLLRRQLAPEFYKKQDLPTLSEYLKDKTPIYERYKSQDHCPHLGTYLVPYFDPKQPPLPKKIMKTQGILFDSKFECGNLFRAYCNDALSYELVLQNDINTKGNNQWFYFSVKGVPAGATLQLRILNMAKKHSLFSTGMKPVVFSTRRHEKRGIGWVREGIKVSYLPGFYRKESSNQSYQVLSFAYKFLYEGDTVYFSYAVPYSLTNLNRFLKNQLNDRSKHNSLNIKHLANTLGGHEIQVFEITNKSWKIDKKVVWVFGRQHPGEVTGSFMMEGIIDFLLSDRKEAKKLRDQFLFKIIPLLNIDGVVHGNTRAQLAGCDPNRQWISPSPQLHPVVYALKRAILKDGNNVEMVLDLHSHSRKCGTFFYGNYEKTNSKSKIFPKMVARADPRFDYDSCRFTGGNEAAARRALHEVLSTPYIYTVESSFYGYKQPQTFKIKHYTPQDYREMGVTLMQVFEDMHSTPNPEELIRDIESLSYEEDRLDKSSVGSDEDPGADELTPKELNKIMMAENKKIKKRTKKIIKDILPIVKEPVKENEKVNKQLSKLEKESYYRKYFSGRCSMKIIREEKPINSITIATQTELADLSLKIRTSLNNITARTSRPSNNDLKELIHLRTTVGFKDILIEKGLCVKGEQVQDKITVFNNTVGTQTEDAQNIFIQRNNRSISQKVKSIHNENKLFAKY